MLKGIDISSYQKGIQLAKLTGIDFCIIKATEGIRFSNPEFFNQYMEFSSKLLGAYHFARPDLNKGREGAIKEATFFVDFLEENGFPGAGIICLDFEKPSNDANDDREWIEVFLKYIKDRTGIEPFLYSYNSFISLPEIYSLSYQYPIWLADYRSKYSLESPPMNVEWYIWQYSGTGVIKGYNGCVDLNYSNMERSEWYERSVPRRYDTKWEWAIKHCYFTINDKRMETITKGQLADILYIILNK